MAMPRIWQITKEIDNRFRSFVWQNTQNADTVERMAIMSNGVVRMANLCVAGSHCVNGVSALHSDILKDTVFSDFYALNPGKFTNVTNGIAHRRWLCQANPKLTSFLTETIGDGFVKNADTLLDLRKFKDDKAVLDELGKIKDTLVAPFKIVNAPLFRCRLFETENAVYLFFDVHHIVFDGTSLDILINNEWSGILTYVGSIFFGIFAIISLGYNGVNLGIVGQLFSQYVPNGGLKYIVYLIPHGIFEITAIVLQSVAGILLFLFIWRFIRAMISKDVHGASEAFNQNKKVLIQSLIIMIFSAILLVIAALIEAYFSVPFSEFIVGA